MTTETGQQELKDTDEDLRKPTQRASKKMNGDWKKIMFQVYGLGAVFIIAIGVIWQTVLLPQLKESQSSAATLREQIPKQTLLLEDIRDQGVESQMFEKAVSSTHSAQSQLLLESAALQQELLETNSEAHKEICEALGKKNP